MTARIEMEPDWQEQLRAAEREFFDVQLGPDILDDMHRFVPVDTGRLDSSLAHQVVDGDDGAPRLEVGSFPDADGDVEYAMAVEFGYHGEEIVHEHTARSSRGNEYTVREHIRHANQPAEPYMRPALYQERYQ